VHRIFTLAASLAFLAVFIFNPSTVLSAAPPATKNPSTASSHAATPNSAREDFELGWKYLFGIGVPKDEAKGKALIRKAAESGDADAQFNYGISCTKGKRGAQGFAEAVKWYRKAAEQGHMFAQVNLGICYAKGSGVSQDHSEAVKWYRRAADQGDAYAQKNLGVCCAKGEGVAKNDVDAYKWFNLAAAQGFEGAADYRERIAADMTPDKIAEAQRLSSSFVPRKESAPLPAGHR